MIIRQFQKEIMMYILLMIILFEQYHLGYYIFQFEVEFDKNQLFPRPAYVSDINSVLGGNLISLPQKPILDRRKLLNS